MCNVFSFDVKYLQYNCYFRQLSAIVGIELIIIATIGLCCSYLHIMFANWIRCLLVVWPLFFVFVQLRGHNTIGGHPPRGPLCTCADENFHSLCWCLNPVFRGYQSIAQSHKTSETALFLTALLLLWNFLQKSLLIFAIHL